jgi:hypothetical protein
MFFDKIFNFRLGENFPYFQAQRVETAKISGSALF